MNTLRPVLAAVNGDLLRLLVIIAILVLSGLGQLIGRLKQAKPPRPGPGRPQPPKPKVGQPDNPVAKEIDEFLRRVAERSQRKGVEPVAKPRLPELPAKPKVSALPKTSTEKPVVAEAAAEVPIGRQVTEHVTKYLDEQEFARRSAQLGAEVAEIDREVDQHLRQTFDHSLSKLASVPGETAAPPSVESAEPVQVATAVAVAGPESLLLALAHPDSIRQAIVLNEILHRPEERWV